jgi:hypothetical protein
MAKLTCGKCGAEFGFRRTGRNSYQTSLGGDVVINCVEIQARLKEFGSTSDHDCKYIDQAIEAARIRNLV